MNQPIEVPFFCSEAENVPIKSHLDDAGFDLRSVEPGVIPAGRHAVFNTGTSFDIPSGYFGMVCDRSGLAANHGITTLAGIIDSGYLGQVKVVLFNTGDLGYEIKKGDKIAQLVILPVPDIKMVSVRKFRETDRGTGGFGSTGR